MKLILISLLIIVMACSHRKSIKLKSASIIRDSFIQGRICDSCWGRAIKIFKNDDCNKDTTYPK